MTQGREKFETRKLPMMPIRDVVHRYGVRYLVTMDGMLTEQFVAELPAARKLTRGAYHLYCFEDFTC